MAVQRINVLNVPVDICSASDMEGQIMEMLAKPGTKQIVFLSIWDLLRARGHNDYAECVRNADLVLPISKSILRGAKFLKKDIPLKHNPFNTLISIMSILETHLKSIYLLGGRKKTVMAATKNVMNTFKTLQVVGRYVGYYPKNVEDDIIQAIYKASPSLVLVSEGIKEKDCWSYKRRNRFSSSIFLYYRDAIGIFGDRIKRVSETSFNRNTEIWHEVIKNPLKVFLIFPWLHYNILLVWYRLFRNKEQSV
ncbi:MAG: WecB/TagA/CpsF family glycosyltransferase [Treponema sp.]|nr:WecB/TagA/CpsF family glycosyltransferase [Treponema sp.]